MTNGHGQANGRAAKTLITTYERISKQVGQTDEPLWTKLPLKEC